MRKVKNAARGIPEEETKYTWNKMRNKKEKNCSIIRKRGRRRKKERGRERKRKREGKEERGRERERVSQNILTSSPYIMRRNSSKIWMKRMMNSRMKRAKTISVRFALATMDRSVNPSDISLVRVLLTTEAAWTNTILFGQEQWRIYHRAGRAVAPRFSGVNITLIGGVASVQEFRRFARVSAPLLPNPSYAPGQEGARDGKMHAKKKSPINTNMVTKSRKNSSHEEKLRCDVIHR